MNDRSQSSGVRDIVMANRLPRTIQCWCRESAVCMLCMCESWGRNCHDVPALPRGCVKIQIFEECVFLLSITLLGLLFTFTQLESGGEHTDNLFAEHCDSAKMKKMTGQFRATTWDPFLIVSQIVALQCVMYVGLGLWMVVMDTLVGSSRSLDHLFKYQEIHVRDVNGKLVITAFVLNALVGSLGLWCIVQRTKQCLDFTCTAHLIHLLVCWFYNAHFPNAFSWWLLNIACLAIMCVCGEFLCMRTELQAIPVNLGPKVDL